MTSDNAVTRYGKLSIALLDFALTSQQNTQRLNLDWEALHRIKGTVVCSPNNPLRHSPSLRQLQYANWISLDEVDDRSSQFYQMFEVNDIHPPQKVIECASLFLALRLVENADAFMTLSNLALGSALPPGRVPELVLVEVEEVIPEYPIYLVCVDRHSLTSPARDLFYGLKSKLAAESSAEPNY
jgi:DNA-binding transcriptional LysR family regulator